VGIPSRTIFVHQTTEQTDDDDKYYCIIDKQVDLASTHIDFSFFHGIQDIPFK
jgi:hypothetical protein